jgi:hypothetical protein
MMTEKPTIFLSYAREDRARVEQVYDALRAEGLNPWLDIRSDYGSVILWSQKRASDQWIQPDHFPQNDPDYLNLNLVYGCQAQNVKLWT